MTSSSSPLQLIAAKAYLVKESSNKSSRLHKYYVCIWWQPHVQSLFLVCSGFGEFVGHTYSFNTLQPKQNGRQFPDIFKYIFVTENVWITIKISLRFVP